MAHLTPPVRLQKHEPYAVNGEQYVTMTVGNTVCTFGLDDEGHPPNVRGGR